MSFIIFNFFFYSTLGKPLTVRKKKKSAAMLEAFYDAQVKV